MKKYQDAFRKKMEYEIDKYISLFHKYEYLCDKRDHSKNVISSKYWAMQVMLCDRKKNNQGIKLGIEITPGCLGESVRICHQNVIINGRVGAGCVFHGNNVIGNKKTGKKDEVPTLGKNVDVGVGAIVIGKIEIADDCVIGAGAVVTKSFTKPGTVIVGVPAKEIQNKE